MKPTPAHLRTRPMIAYILGHFSPLGKITVGPILVVAYLGGTAIVTVLVALRDLFLSKS